MLSTDGRNNLAKLTVEEIGRLYDRAGRAYGLAQPVKEFAGLAKMRRRLFSHARGEVLEVGVGTGVNLGHYPAGCRVTAVDLSPRMLGLARQRARRLSVEVALGVMDAGRLEYVEASFDTVVSSFSVCTFPDPVTALGEMGRVCLPGGRILLLQHGLSDTGWVARLQRLRARWRPAKRGCHNDRDPIALARAAGLEVVCGRRWWFGVFYELEARPCGS